MTKKKKRKGGPPGRVFLYRCDQYKDDGGDWDPGGGYMVKTPAEIGGRGPKPPPSFSCPMEGCRGTLIYVGAYVPEGAPVKPPAKAGKRKNQSSKVLYLSEEAKDLVFGDEE